MSLIFSHSIRSSAPHTHATHTPGPLRATASATDPRYSNSELLQLSASVARTSALGSGGEAATAFDLGGRSYLIRSVYQRSGTGGAVSSPTQPQAIAYRVTNAGQLVGVPINGNATLRPPVVNTRFVAFVPFTSGGAVYLIATVRDITQATRTTPSLVYRATLDAQGALQMTVAATIPTNRGWGATVISAAAGAPVYFAIADFIGAVTLQAINSTVCVVVTRLVVVVVVVFCVVGQEEVRAEMGGRECHMGACLALMCFVTAHRVTIYR